MPEPRRPTILQQESQDEYGALAFDNDLIAALDEEDLPEYQAMDRSLCKVGTYSYLSFAADTFVSFWKKT